MEGNIDVLVLTPIGPVYSGIANWAILPGESGGLGIYPNHISLITLLKPGEIRLFGSDDSSILISGGIASIGARYIKVLADMAYRSSKMDAVWAEEAERAAQESLSKTVSVEAKRLALQEIAMVQARVAALKKLKKLH